MQHWRLHLVSSGEFVWVLLERDELSPNYAGYVCVQRGRDEGKASLNRGLCERAG